MIIFYSDLTHLLKVYQQLQYMTHPYGISGRGIGCVDSAH